MRLRKLIYKILNSQIIRRLRNFSRIKPAFFSFDYEKNYIASDLFIWRNDNGFETVFKASNIMQKYYNADSYLKFIFFTNNGEFLFEFNQEFEDKFINLKFDSKLFKKNSYGTFCAFNFPKKIIDFEVNITNRCYLGYKKNNSVSMAHGNLVSQMIKVDKQGNFDIKNLQPAVISNRYKSKYIIQKPFKSSYTNYLLFTNPTSRNIKITINSDKLEILPRGCAIYKLSFFDEHKPIEIKSDFFFSRPYVISEKGNFFDFHHG